MTGRSFWAVNIHTTPMEAANSSSALVAPSLRLNSPYGAAPPRESAFEWYALQTRPRHEKRVAQEVRAREIEALLPVHRCRNRWRNGVTAVVELPLFPCYLFVHVPLCERLRLLQLPGVIGFAVNSARPTALAQQDIDAVRMLSTACGVKPHPFLKLGDRVRIIAGPLTGMEGILLRRKNELRVVLSLDFILRSIAVEVSEFDIEPVGARRPA